MKNNRVENNKKQSELEFPKIIKGDNVIRDSVISILCFVFGIFILLASFNAAGKVGNIIFSGITYIFGWISFLLFALFFIYGYKFWIQKNNTKVGVMTILTTFVLIFSITIFTSSIGLPFGGFVSEYADTILKNNLGKILPSIISFALGLIAFIFLYEDRPRLNIDSNKIKDVNNLMLEKSGKAGKSFFEKIKSLFIFSNSKNKTPEMNIENENYKENYDDEKNVDLHSELLGGFTKSNNNNENEENLDQTNHSVEVKEWKKAKQKSEDERLQSIKEESKPVIIEDKFIPPPLSLLNSDSGKSSAGDSKFKMNVIQKVLDQFNIPVEMGEVTVGPSVTQFTLKPAQGVPVRKILGLKDNLQMALSATNIHIEAPIPGKPFVGIEIPNEKKTTLGLRSLLEIQEFQAGSPLSLAIGKNIIGKPVISDLAKMPHLLVAGATGTGKSVTLHNLIFSLLYKNSPYDLKLIILDPKRVEFTTYNSLPHLYTPIIKDAKTAIKSLNWAAQEMDRRYDVLGEYGVPNLGDYNKKIFFPALEKAKRKNNDGDKVEGLPPKMPYIVIIFDEFNDFMLTYPKEITPIITSLTQKARAAGIHLILATQRPDVKVITGTIKANIPSRIALKTTSQIDSRTILDQAGAEDLLGNGDMLYMNGSTITRVQAPFVSSEEIKAIIDSIKKRYYDFIPDSIDIQKVKITSSSTNGYKEMESENRNPTEEPADDEDYMSARDYVISTGKASTSALQTAFRWGYNKSARIMNDLENYGIIGPATSGRHREVLFGKNTESEVEKLERELEEIAEDK